MVHKTWDQLDRYLYFIQREDTQSIKIGMSIDPVDRFRELQNKYEATRLELLGIFVDKIYTDFSYHDKFAHLRLSGEWFSPEPDLLDFINRNTTLDFPEFNWELYHELRSTSPGIRCSFCDRRGRGMIAGKNPITGKTGLYHRHCYATFWTRVELGWITENSYLL